MNRLDTLKAAAECVCGSREEDYGSPEDNFAVIAALWLAVGSIPRKHPAPASTPVQTVAPTPTPVSVNPPQIILPPPPTPEDEPSPEITPEPSPDTTHVPETSAPENLPG